jgi:hypothetical protein
LKTGDEAFFIAKGQVDGVERPHSRNVERAYRLSVDVRVQNEMIFD